MTTATAAKGRRRSLLTARDAAQRELLRETLIAKGWHGHGGEDVPVTVFGHVRGTRARRRIFTTPVIARGG